MKGTDTTPMANTLAALATLLAGQLQAAADDLLAGKLTDWQLLAVAASLDELKRKIHYLRRDAGATHYEESGR